MIDRPIHPDFRYHLNSHSAQVIELYTQLRQIVLTRFPEANELLYHTHVLTSVYSFSTKLQDAFIHLPLYTEHVNLGFNQGATLPDPFGLLSGTGKWIRHIPIRHLDDLQQAGMLELMQTAADRSRPDERSPQPTTGQTISKIKPRQ